MNKNYYNKKKVDHEVKVINLISKFLNNILKIFLKLNIR